MRVRIYILIVVVIFASHVSAQNKVPPKELKKAVEATPVVQRTAKNIRVYKTKTEVENKPITCKAQVINGDTFPVFDLPTLWVYPKMKFKNSREEREYYRLVRDVKKVLPLSKFIKQVIIETNDTLLTMSTKKERDAYMKGFEKRMYKSQYDRFSKLTLRQGTLLIRILDREMDATSYELIKAYRGKVRAGFYQMFAKMLGGDLKATFGSKKEDVWVERIINQVESGQI